MDKSQNVIKDRCKIVIQFMSVSVVNIPKLLSQKCAILPNHIRYAVKCKLISSKFK